MFTRYETVDGPKCSSSSQPASSAEAMSQASFDVGCKRRGMRRSGEVGWSGRRRWGWIDCSCFGLTTATADTARANNNSSLYFCTTTLIQPPPPRLPPSPACLLLGWPPACMSAKWMHTKTQTHIHTLTNTQASRVKKDQLPHKKCDWLIVMLLWVSLIQVHKLATCKCNHCSTLKENRSESGVSRTFAFNSMWSSEWSLSACPWESTPTFSNSAAVSSLTSCCITCSWHGNGLHKLEHLSNSFSHTENCKKEHSQKPELLSLACQHFACTSLSLHGNTYLLSVPYYYSTIAALHERDAIMVCHA